VATEANARSAVVTRKPRRRASFRRRETLAFYGFVSPWLLGFIFLGLLPIIAGFLISLSNFNGINLRGYTVGGVHYRGAHYIGFEKYVRAIHDPYFWHSLATTGKIALIVIPLGIVVQIALALLLNSGIKLLGFWRTMFFMPFVIPVVAKAYMWKAITDQDGGFLNRIIGFAGGSRHIDWLNGHPTSLLIMFLIWGGAGLGMLIFLAGMRSIPEELYEAARIDGAGRIRSFRSITLPLLTPVLMFQIVTGMIVVSSMFQEPLLLSPNLQAGLGTYVPEGTHVFNIEALQQIMVTGDWGYGAAEIWLFVPILLLITAVIFFSGRLWVYSGSEQYK
jgi:multiple sugar transport system permease protein